MLVESKNQHNGKQGAACHKVDEVLRTLPEMPEFTYDVVHI